MSNDQFYKPGSISPSSIGPGNFYNDNDVADPTYPYTGPNPIPAGTTIIDQATFVNAQLIALPGAAPDPNFVPTEYSATQDVNNNITHLNIDVSNMYGSSMVDYRIVNTDNILALTHPTLGVGVDVYDPAAIEAGINRNPNISEPYGFQLLYASVLSILDASRSRTLSIACRSAGAKMSTTERNASTPRNGWIIYNSTSHTFQGYADGAWINLH
jgi:hypothetical protein